MGVLPFQMQKPKNFIQNFQSGQTHFTWYLSEIPCLESGLLVNGQKFQGFHETSSMNNSLVASFRNDTYACTHVLRIRHSSDHQITWQWYQSQGSRYIQKRCSKSTPFLENSQNLLQRCPLGCSFLWEKAPWEKTQARALNHATLLQISSKPPRTIMQRRLLEQWSANSDS